MPIVRIMEDVVIGDIVRHCHEPDKTGIVTEMTHWTDGDIRDIRVLWDTGESCVEWVGQVRVVDEKSR